MNQGTDKLPRPPSQWRMRSGSRARMLVMLMSPSSSLFAHPGHDHAVVPPSQPAHWLVEPQHAAVWLGMCVVVWIALKAVRAMKVQASPVSETQR